MMRLAVLFLLNASMIAADASPAPTRAPVTTQRPRIVSVIHPITLRADGSPDAAGQAELDDLTDHGWRAVSITPMAVAAGAPVTIAVLFSRLARPGWPPAAATPPARR